MYKKNLEVTGLKNPFLIFSTWKFIGEPVYFLFKSYSEDCPLLKAKIQFFKHNYMFNRNLIEYILCLKQSEHTESIAVAYQHPRSKFEACWITWPALVLHSF